jgi:hypothetical protein
VVIPDLPLTVDDQRTVEFDDIGIVISKFVPGAVAADDYVLGHRTSRREIEMPQFAI